ncbi:MAG: pyruvate formate lyase family protein [Dehalococcoidia bacterium]|nr:pyruvate formate lyase family protein [Dehalococcoidia bacterium]
MVVKMSTGAQKPSRFASGERPRKLKSKRVRKSTVVTRIDGGLDRSTTQFTYLPGVRICFETARLMTESYQSTEGQPEVIRRARALDHILSHMTVYISDDELIVGNIASDPYGLPIHPELQWKDMDKAIKGDLAHMVDECGRTEWEKIRNYWKGKTIDDRMFSILPDEIKKVLGPGGKTEMTWAAQWSSQKGLGSPNYHTLFDLGLNGVIGKAEDRLRRLGAELKEESISSDAYIDKLNSLQAMIIAGKALISFSGRYAALAREMASKEQNAERGEELLQIAEVCDWIPGNPPRTFHEALQAWYLTHMVTRFIEYHGQGEGSRLDVLLNPLYQKDIEANRITREQAQELLECAWMKMEEIGEVETSAVHRGEEGASLYQIINIGGVTPDGDDATNEMSFLIIDACEAIQATQPSIVLRYHPTINPELISRAIDMIRTGIGHPAFINDNAVIPYLLNRGIPLRDARNWTSGGCLQPIIPGKAMQKTHGLAAALLVPKVLEVAMNQGKSMTTGIQLGCVTPDPTTFKSFDEVLDAYEAQWAYQIEHVAKVEALACSLYRRTLQRPLMSALTDDCIERGQDCMEEFYHSLPTVHNVGQMNVIDSMAAIKKLVFDEKTVSMAELIDAWKNNFKGKDELFKKMRKSPKFGNDDDYVDLLAREICNREQYAVERFRTESGFMFTLEGSTASMYFPWSIGALSTPDGRRSDESFADGSISPMRGRDTNGPTAVLKSVGKVNPKYSMLLNQKFFPKFLEGKAKALFVAYLRTWADLGCWHVQFNVVSPEVLQDAQKHPENHGDLIVRVAGYSAHFVDLSIGLQNEIIQRTTQSLG